MAKKNENNEEKFAYDENGRRYGIPPRCPDCGATPGELHDSLCEIEPCPGCGTAQYVYCECRLRHEFCRIPWTGEWPGKDQCREFGFYLKLDENGFWLPERCSEDYPRKTEDLATLYILCKWNPFLKGLIRLNSVEASVPLCDLTFACQIVRRRTP